MQLDLEALGSGLSDIMERSLTPLWDRLRVIQSDLDEVRSVTAKPGPCGEAGPSGPSGPAGPPGKDADPVTRDFVLSAIEPDVIAEAVARYLEANPPAAGRDGSPGEPGEKGESIVGPPGEKGERGDLGPSGGRGEPGPAGRDGSDGSDGLPGELSVAPDDVADQVARAISLIAESPPLQARGAAPIILNLSSPESNKRHKTITTRKDESGNLVADVVESDIA